MKVVLFIRGDDVYLKPQVFGFLFGIRKQDNFSVLLVILTICIKLNGNKAAFTGSN